MRKIYAVLVSVLIVSLALAGNPKKYGKEITKKEVTKISDILANPEEFDGKRVLVEGAVVDVCAMRGCWIKLASDKEFETIRFKVEDGVIIFPMDAKGKDARAEGVVSVRTQTVDQQIKQGEEHAKEEGKTFDPSTVKGPKTIIQINGEGAVIE
ncbi:MAG: DUF4920 domain-containing protein [Ignavibacteriae bacterium]|nr:DUF4920 domain-containing protein [Ignavibacteriota bacterium]